MVRRKWEWATRPQEHVKSSGAYAWFIATPGHWDGQKQEPVCNEMLSSVPLPSIPLSLKLRGYGVLEITSVFFFFFSFFCIGNTEKQQPLTGIKWTLVAYTNLNSIFTSFFASEFLWATSPSFKIRNVWQTNVNVSRIFKSNFQQMFPSLLVDF